MSTKKFTTLADFLDARRICGPATANHEGVVAKAREIWISDGAFECTIDAAGPQKELPTQHDRDHANVASLIFSHRKDLSALRCEYAVLRYHNGVHRRVTVSIKRAKRLIRLLNQRDRPQPLDLPAPLVSFLVSNEARMSLPIFVCRKQRNSQLTVMTEREYSDDEGMGR